MVHLPNHASPRPKILFDSGTVLCTPGIVELFKSLGDLSFDSFLRRHFTGDWGDIDEHDQRVNQSALANGQRILSAYTVQGDQKIWIITEADRSSTTILLPEEY